MNPREPFTAQDLDDLDDQLLDKALSVTTMAAVFDGQRHNGIVGMRHDVDNFIEPAVQFAEWEAERGYRSTYYILHTAPYWRNKPLLQRSLGLIAELGHEIGIHNNALSVCLSTGRDPVKVLADAVGELRGYGHEIRSTVAHGDRLCYDQHGKVRFVNDEMFDECPRPEVGEPGRTVAGMRLRPVPLGSLGLDFDANWIGRGAYLSDSGGCWSPPGFDTVAAGFPYDKQLHVLIHADWWREAFARQEIAA